MKKILANLFGAFATGFLTAWGTGMPPKEAAIAGAMAAAGAVTGVMQEKPKQ